jgi:hypothetical protein
MNNEEIARVAAGKRAPPVFTRAVGMARVLGGGEWRPTQPGLEAGMNIVYLEGYRAEVIMGDGAPGLLLSLLVRPPRLSSAPSEEPAQIQVAVSLQNSKGLLLEIDAALRRLRERFPDA